MRRTPFHVPAAPRDERGLTLTELAIVGTLAVLVMLSLTGFYYNSQKMWMEGSTQAMAQRDATLIRDVLARRVHVAASATVDVSDPLHHVIALFDDGGTQLCQIGWEPGDSKIHTYDAAGVSTGPIADSRALRFQATTVGATLVELTLLELLSADGDTVRTTSRFALYGHDNP